MMVRSDYDSWKTEGWYTKDLLPLFREVIELQFTPLPAFHILTQVYCYLARELSKPL